MSRSRFWRSLIITFACACSAFAVAGEEIDVQTLDTKRKEGAIVLIDVRTPAEFASGHAPGAINRPISELSTWMSELKDPSVPIYLICEVGGRSGQVAQELSERGFAHPVNVVGGTRAWREAGLELVKPGQTGQ